MAKPTYLDLLAKYEMEGAHPGGMPLTMELLKKLHIDSNTKLLDVGCGTGQTSAFIAKNYFCDVTAVDINTQMLKKSIERFNMHNLNIHSIQADAEDLPFESQSFDILLSESVTAFINIKRAIREYYRVLKRFGTLIAIEITSETRLHTNDLNNIKFVYNIDQVLTRDEWINSFTQAGFIDINSYKVAARPTNRITSIKMLKDFSPHLKILNTYRRKLGFSVFICKK